LAERGLADDDCVGLVHTLRQQHEDLESTRTTSRQLTNVTDVAAGQHGKICGVFSDLFQVKISVWSGELDVQYI
jgi:hypothetical protein